MISGVMKLPATRVTKMCPMLSSKASSTGTRESALKQLGLEGGLHAFRHGNATAQDRLHTPLKVRQERLGHVSSRTTMHCTHLVGGDDRRVVEQLDDLFCPLPANQTEGRIM